MKRVLLALLAAALLVTAAPAQARPSEPAAETAKKKLTKKQKFAKACKSKAKRKKMSKAKRRRCAKLLKKKQRPKAIAPAAPAPGGGSSAPGAPVPTPVPPGGDPGPEAPDLPPSNPRALQVVSGEFFLNLSQPEVLAGDVRVEFNNAYAEDPHDLHLVRRNGDGDSYSFGELQAGEVEARTLDLNAGSWQLFCALPEHAERGMMATLKVTG